MTISKQNRIDALLEAQDHLYEAIELIEQATKDSCVEGRARSYIIPWLTTWIGRGNKEQFGNLEELMDTIENPEDY